MMSFVSTFYGLAPASPDSVPFRDLIVLSAALLAVACLVAAGAVWLSSNRRAWILRVGLED